MSGARCVTRYTRNKIHLLALMTQAHELGAIAYLAVDACMALADFERLSKGSIGLGRDTVSSNHMIAFTSVRMSER